MCPRVGVYTAIDVDADIAAHAILTKSHGATTAIADTDDIAAHAAIAAVHHAKTVIADLSPIALADLVAAVCSEAEADGKITTHGTGAKHRWTLNKLLKGAGAGANPTEIDVPSGKSIATGNYTGNDGEDRQITTGFIPSLVIIITLAAGRLGILIPNATLAGDQTNEPADDTAAHYMHASDGFVVSKTGTRNLNADTVVHYYFAISE